MTLARALQSLDDLVHSPVRFALMSALNSVDQADYQTIKENLGLSYALLTKHATILERAGYLHVMKEFSSKSPRTSYALTAKGRSAYSTHLAALDELVAGLSTTPSDGSFADSH
jgi:DNA-binding MarR family transcriptional regulator